MFQNCDLCDGFHAIEHDDCGPFVWTYQRARLRLRQAGAFTEILLCYNGDDGSMTVRSQRGVDRVQLTRGWQSVVARLDASQGEIIELDVEPIIAVPGDTRVLGVMLRQVELFDAPDRFDKGAARQTNLWLNQHEYQTGQSTLESVAPLIRINTEVRCNIPETGVACVYCAWDWAKEVERGSPAFTLSTLDDLGAFYRSASEVNDCSIGEPTMNKDFGAIVERIDRDGKQFSLTTNGQLLNARRRREILGKNLSLYVSMDSATAEGYARFRNERFDDIVDNLTALCHEKKQHRDLPKLHVSFIAMRSNVDELPRFFELMRDIGVDEIKMRALYLDDNLAPVTVNQGFRFDYANELLNTGELAALSPRIRALASEVAIPIYVEWDQFEKDSHVPGMPLCSEPWKTLYVLSRGIMPCCYATEPIATWDQQQGRPLEEFLREVFNSAAYQEIRSELAAGRMSDFCLNTPSCPILKHMQHEGLIETPNKLFPQHAIAAVHDVASRLPIVPLEMLARSAKQAA